MILLWLFLRWKVWTSQILFTFQYDSIMTFSPFLINLTTATFTFQYDSIMTLLWPPRLSISPSIYISVWFYYDNKSMARTWIQNKIYISVWFYYDRVVKKMPYGIFQFTFQYDSIMTFKFLIIFVFSNIIYISVWFYYDFFMLSIVILILYIYISVWFYYDNLEEKPDYLQ